MKTYQYRNVLRGDEKAWNAAKWIAAPTEEAADAYALKQGWRPACGQVLDENATERELGASPSEIDVVLPDTDRPALPLKVETTPGVYHPDPILKRPARPDTDTDHNAAFLADPIVISPGRVPQAHQVENGEAFKPFVPRPHLTASDIREAEQSFMLRVNAANAVIENRIREALAAHLLAEIERNPPAVPQAHPDTAAIALASAFKDIVNAADNGEGYTPEELMGDAFDDAREALSEIEARYGIDGCTKAETETNTVRTHTQLETDMTLEEASFITTLQAQRNLLCGLLEELDEHFARAIDSDTPINGWAAVEWLSYFITERVRPAIHS